MYYYYIDSAGNQTPYQPLGGRSKTFLYGVALKSGANLSYLPMPVGRVGEKE